MLLSFSNLVAVAADRITRLARPPDGEPPPLQGATPAEWAVAAGIGTEPHALLVAAKAQTLDAGIYPPSQVARRALQRLVEREIMEWAGPGRWRPVARVRRR